MARREATIGVRELRTRLSAYLREVASGKTITIGDRARRPIARLVPVQRCPDAEVLDRLAARGVLARGAGKPSPKPVKPRRRGRTVAEIVIEDRD
jgi:prevent-host-death family protein